jgi:hypothetical protein
LVLAIPHAAGPAHGFGPGEAAARSQSGHPIVQTVGNADFKVLIWFRRADPLATFKYQVYDVRKGEYTAAVETWVKDVQTKYPSYLAVVRDVDLKHENGETEKLRLAVPKDVIRILLRGRCTRERQPARSHSTSARGPNSALPFPCSAA